MCAKIRRISSGPGRRASAEIRVAYQATASSHSCIMVTSGRGAIPRAWHHAFTSSSDRKNSMVLQVKPRSSHQCAAGTWQ